MLICLRYYIGVFKDPVHAESFKYFSSYAIGLIIALSNQFAEVEPIFDAKRVPKNVWGTNQPNLSSIKLVRILADGCLCPTV